MSLMNRIVDFILILQDKLDEKAREILSFFYRSDYWMLILKKSPWSVVCSPWSFITFAEK